MPALSQEFKFRDVYNPRVINALADRLRARWPDFDASTFAADAAHGLDALGMNDRAAQITRALTTHLPDDYPTATQLLIDAQAETDVTPGKTNWDGFIVIPQCAWVAEHGVTRPEHFDLSMRALHTMTKRLSAEGHLRHFIEMDPDRAFATLRAWSSDPDPHVRRLVSEGTRPRLPMTGRIQRFIDDPKTLIDLLEPLKADPSEYVRRSVANNLNDISKDNPEVALDALERWNQTDDEGTRWLVRHALRTLLKAGHPRALAIQGYTPNPSLNAPLTLDTEAVQIGDDLHFTATLTSTGDTDQHLLIDYVVHFVKASGKQKPKVFKWTRRTLKPGESVTIERKQHMRPTSGRKLYPGEHGVALQINGVEGEVAVFRLDP